MMYDDYLSFGGVEIANSARAKAYAESASCPVYWIKTEACENLPVALNHLPYNSETVYDSPWYDPANRDLSTRFFGVVVVSVKGLSDSSREISTIEGIKDGGVISGQRRGSRRARYRLALIARGADALEYGINWLSSKLDGQKCGQHGTRCGTSDLQFFADCPPPMEFDYTFDPDPSRTVRNLFTNPNLVGSGEYATVAENLFTNPRLKGDGTYATVAENLFTNPRLKGDGTYATVAENLFTNPRLKGDGTWAEVRRNYLKQPLLSQSNTEWTLGVGATKTASSEGMTVTTPSSSNGIALIFLGAVQTATSPGEVWSALARVRNNGDAPLHISLYINNGVGAHNGPTYIIPPGETVDVSHENYEMPSDSTGIRIGFRSMFEMSNVSFTIFDHVSIERVERITGLFSSDPDMRTRWLGTPNDSESVMEIERVRGVTAVNCIAVVSTWEGKPAVRLIPTTYSSNSYIEISPRYEVLATGTFTGLGVVHTREAISGSLSNYQKRIRTLLPDVNSAVYGPNTPNTSTSIRHVFQWGPPAASSGRILFYHGGSQGSGDVWWTDIGLFAGNYPYEIFHGDSDPADTGIAQPEDFRIRWTGAEDSSTSVMEIEQVRGLSTNGYGITGVSSIDGTPAIRCIGTDPNLALVAWFMIPVKARAHGTLIGTLHIKSTLTNPAPDALKVRARYPTQTSDTAPNLPGSYPLSVEFTELTYGNEALIVPGVKQGSGEVWYTDIGLFAGKYPYEAFNGESDPAETGIAQPEDFRIRWTGEVDNSTSVMEIERVADILTGSNSIAGVSTKSGKPAVRIIPTGSDLSLALVAISTTVSSVTAMGTVTLDAPLQGTLDDNALTLGAGGIAIVSAPNLAGDHPLRVTGGEPFDGYISISLTNGATQGNGDVWWSDIGVYSGNYTGENFTGSDDPSVTGLAQPEDFRIRWTGEPDNSTSVLEIERVAGADALGASNSVIAGKSTWEGNPAVRIIPNTPPQPAGDALVGVSFITGSSEKPGVLRVTLGLIKPLQPVEGSGNTAGVWRGRVSDISQMPPETTHLISNEAGTYDITFNYPSDSLPLVLITGGSQIQGSGDLWASQIGVFETESGEPYAGPLFTGDFPSTPEPNDNPTIYSWEGEPNNSVSRREHGQWIATEKLERHRGLVNEVTRFMHDVAVSSGPLLIEEYEKGGVNAAIVEVNFQSERGYIYGAPRELNLDAAELSSVNDVGINLIPNPRGRLKSTADSTIARNAVTNPSFETNLTGWSATVGTISRPFQELRARGDYSLKIATTGLNARATHAIASASRSSATRAVLGVWVALTSSGAKVPSSIELVVGSGSTVYASRTIPTPPANAGQYYTLDVEGVRRSGDVEISVDARWAGGTTQSVALYLDTVMFLQDG